MPLENQTVRFIDNFSNGNRGATSAEYFLEAGYSVVFMHRQNSIQPYHRHYTHSNMGFLDYLEPKEDGSVQGIVLHSLLTFRSNFAFSSSPICSQNAQALNKIQRSQGKLPHLNA